MRLNSARRDGLSLLEVLVSLAIFLMALVALTYLVNNSSNLAAEGQNRARAAQLARSKMNEFTSGALAMESQPDSSFDDEPDFRWTAEVTEGAATGLFTVTITVTHRPDDPFPLKVAFSRMILDPKYAGSTQDVPAPPDDSAADSGTDPSSGSSGSGSSGASASAGGSASSSGASMSKGGTSSASPAAGAKSSGGASSPSMGSAGASKGASSGAGMGSGGATGGMGSGGKGKS